MSTVPLTDPAADALLLAAARAAQRQGAQPPPAAPVAPAAPAVVEPDGELVVDPDEWTLRDLEDFAREVGVEFEVAFDGAGRPSTGALIGLLWITRRRADPAVTVDTVRDMSLADLRRRPIRFVGDDDEPGGPTVGPEAEPAAGPSAASS